MGTGLLTLATVTAQVASSFVAHGSSQGRPAPQDEGHHRRRQRYLSLVGLELGDRLDTKTGERGELLGGMVFIVVGIAIGSGIL